MHRASRPVVQDFSRTPVITSDRVLRLAVTLFSLLLLSIALAPSMDRLSVPVQRLSAPSQSFTLKALTPTLNASQGMRSFSTIMVTGYGGYTGNVSLSVA